MRPTLRQLQYLVAIAEAGSFSRAAEAAGVSQPSLSTQIKDMEATLGAPLMERGRGGAPLTPLGEELLVRARRVLREVEVLKAVARESGDTLAGRVRLGTLPSVGPYLLPLAVRRLHEAYPQLRIEVREERTTDLERHLADARLDVIISTPEDHPEAERLHLFSEEMFVGVAPDDALALTKGDLALSELKGRNLLTLGYGHKLAVLVTRLAEEAGAKVSAGYRGTSLDAIRQMAAMGEDVAVMPSLYARSEAMGDPGVVVRRIAHPEARRDVALLWRHTSPLRNKFEAMGEVLRKAAADLLT